MSATAIRMLNTNTLITGDTGCGHPQDELECKPPLLILVPSQAPAIISTLWDELTNGDPPSLILWGEE